MNLPRPIAALRARLVARRRRPAPVEVVPRNAAGLDQLIAEMLGPVIPTPRTGGTQ